MIAIVGACVSSRIVSAAVCSWPNASEARTRTSLAPAVRATLNEKWPKESAVVEPSSNRPSVPVSSATLALGSVVPLSVTAGLLSASVPEGRATTPGGFCSASVRGVMVVAVLRLYRHSV